MRAHHRALRRRAAAGLLASVLAAATLMGPAAANQANNNTSKKLRQAVSAEGMLTHLEALQAIADRHGGTRVSGTAGYDESAAYAAQVFRDAGYLVSTQEFEFQTFIEHAGTLLHRVAPAPAADIPTTIFSYSGSGDVTAPVSLTADAGSGHEGCEASDFTGFPAGSIALVQRGTCTFGTKSTNASNAGAVAVVIYNHSPGVINGTLGNDFTLDIPVVSATLDDGQALRSQVGGLVLGVRTSTFRGIATTSNVFAESRHGDPDNIVMAGAHLDSVNAGPGINDNGSGSAAILETARQMAKTKPVNKVRFALWGAEESGLVGARHYIANLPQAERDRIALYLNFDMVASPNYVRFVYDGDNSRFPVGPGAAAGPPGSAQIEQLFHDYFASVGQASAETPFSGRSDYGPFIEVGIPAGGLFTGAEGIKTPAEAEIFGGVAGAAYDPCYHQVCDALRWDFTGDQRAPIYAALNAEFPMRGNVNLAALEEMGDAIAHAILTYAFDTRSVNAEGTGHPVSPPGQAKQHAGAGAGSGTGSGGGLHDHDHEADES